MNIIKNDKEKIEGLRNLYKTNNVAATMLEHFAGRERNFGETRVDRMMSILRSPQDGRDQSINRGSVIAVFRQLETLGCGQFVAGRKGYSSRFEWKDPMSSVGKVAIGETQKIEKLKIESNLEDVPSEEGSHPFLLRKGYYVEIRLPLDFTTSEAERLSGFIKALPLNNSVV